MNSQHAFQHRPRRPGAVAVVGLAAIVAAAAQPSPVTSGSKGLGACTLRPTADSIAFVIDLLDTYRVRDGIAEVLHDVRCSDGRSETVWISATVI